MLKQTLRFLIVAGAVVGLASCGSSNNGSSLTGTYVGTTQDSVGGTGSLRLTVAQSGNSLSGTWAVTYPGGSNGGTLDGSTTGSSITATLTPGVPTACPTALTGTSGGNRITGTYAVFNCTAVDTGSFDVTKQ
jgi:hypothetical protein